MAPRLIKNVYKALFKTKTQEIPRIFLLVMEKKNHLSARVMAVNQSDLRILL